MTRNIAALFLAGLIGVCANAAAQEATDAKPQPPIYDMHFHVMPFMAPDALRERMDKFNIVRAGGAGAVGNPSRPPPVREAEFKKALGDRMIRAVGTSPIAVAHRTGGQQALDDASRPETAKALQQMEAALRDHGAEVLGEIHVNSANFAPPAVRRKMAADGPLVKALWGLAAKYRVPLMIHLEFEPDSFQQLERLLTESDPKVRLILAHCGSTATAAQIRPFLEKYANVVCDLSFRSPPQLGQKSLWRSIFDTNGIEPSWQALIEAYPDRFAVGIDDVQNWEQYDAVASTIRRDLLAHLKPDTARKVAIENAKSWLKK